MAELPRDNDKVFRVDAIEAAQKAIYRYSPLMTDREIKLVHDVLRALKKVSAIEGEK